MSENTNYENLSIKKEIEDLSEIVFPTSVPLPTSVFNVEFNNSKELDSGINSNLVMNVNNPTHSQIETPLHALANPANPKPAPKKRKYTRRRHVYSKPKKKNKKKKEAEKMPVLSEQNLQHLNEKKSNDNCSDCSSDTIILDDLDEELLSHTSNFANKLPNILCKEEELEPELGKLLISSGMLLEDADESFKKSSKITNSKDQSKISNVPLIKQEPEEFSEPPVLYPVMKEAVHTYSDHERLMMTTFPLLSGSIKKSTQPLTKKKQTQAARRGNKKQAACEKTVSEPNKILNESLSFDNFSTTDEKDVFSGQSFENINDTVPKSNLFTEKSKRKRPGPRRGTPKKTVQISASLNKECISGNEVTAFPALSASKKKKPQTARRGGKKQTTCERTIGEPNKILNENLTLDNFPSSNEKDFFHGQSFGNVNETVSGNEIAAFPSLSASKKKKPQTARRGGKKQTTCERTIGEPNKILNENLTLDNFPYSNEKDFFHGQSFGNVNETVSGNEIAAFPSLSASKKKKPQTARRGGKKQTTCERTIGEPNKILNENLTLDNFPSSNEKDFFHGQSFGNVNETVSGNEIAAFPSLSASKKKKPQTARRGGKKQTTCERTIGEPNKILNENLTLDNFPYSNEKDFFHGQSFGNVNETVSGKEIAAFPSLSASKKKNPQTARRGGKKQTTCERTVGEPNKILNENLTLDNFPSSNEKDFFHGQSFGNVNETVEKPKRKRSAGKRGASKKTVQISASLNNESVFEQLNNVNYFNNSSFSESDIVQKPKRKKSTPNRMTKKDTLEPKNSFEYEEHSDSFGLSPVKKPKKGAPRKRATRTSAKNKKGDSAKLDKDDVVMFVKKELCDPSYSNSDTVECNVNASNIAPKDTSTFINMCFEADRLSQPLFSNENTFEIESDKVSETSKKCSKSSLCRPGKNLENIVETILPNSILQAKTVTKILPEHDEQNSNVGFQSGTLNLSNLNALKIKKEKENSLDKNTSVETNMPSNMHPQLVDKDMCNDSTAMMANISGSYTNTCVQKYSSISNAHSLINSQNSVIDSEKIDYSSIAIKKEPEDLTECVKTSVDKDLLNLNRNIVSQNQKIISKSNDQEMPQVEHSLQFSTNTEKTHDSALSVGFPNVVSNSQTFDNSMHSSQSKSFEPNNVFVHKIKEEPKETEPNSTITENSSSVKSHSQNELDSEKFSSKKDNMKTFLINETGRENTLKEALPLHSSHDISNGSIASPNLNLNTLLHNESLQTNTWNQEMHLLKSSSNFSANINKNFNSTPFPNINNSVHASDDSGYAQPKPFETPFNSFLNVVIKTEPTETVEKSAYSENEHSVGSLQSLVQLEYETTASKRNSTTYPSDKSDNDGKHKNLGKSNSSYLNSKPSNPKLTSSTSDAHELIFRENFQSKSTTQEMLQIAVPSVKSVENRTESSHSVILPSVPSTYLGRHTSDNAEQIQLEIGKSSSVKVRIKEEPIEDEADEIVANIRSEPSSIHVQQFNELREQNICISEESAARNSPDLFPKKSTEKVSSNEVDVSFNTSKSLANPHAYFECISESTICGRMDKNSSLDNVNSTSGFVSQSLVNEKKLKTVKNSNLNTSSIVTSLQENTSDKLGIDQPSIDTDCSSDLVSESLATENVVNDSPFCAQTDQNVHLTDKVSSSDIISQARKKMLQTMETRNSITSSTAAAHQESTICANTDLDICLIDLDCSSTAKQTVTNENNNNLISSSTFSLKTETFCENEHLSAYGFSSENSNKCTSSPTCINEENAPSLLSKEPDIVLEYNQGLLNSDSSSQSSGSNFRDNLILNSLNSIRESFSNDSIMRSTENLVELSEISDKNNTSEKHIDVPHSFIDEDQNSLDQKLDEMSDVSDSSGSEDEFSDEEVKEFLDHVSSYVSRFDDLLELNDEDENEESVEYIEKCFECISKAVLDVITSDKGNKDNNSEQSLESEKITSKPSTHSDGDSCDVIDSTSFNMNENEETTCTQTVTVERRISRPITTSNIDSVSVALNEITSEENTSNPTVIFEKITSRSITSDDTNLYNMTDSVSTAMNTITSEKEREENICSEDVIFEGISTPVSSCDTDPSNVIELKSVINKNISEKENTSYQTAIFEGIPSRPVIPVHKDPCNATDSEENTCRQTGVFEGTTPSQITSNNSVSIVSEEETTAISERIISEPIASKDNLHNVTDSIPIELEITDDSMDSVQTDISSVSSFSLNQNDGKFDILFNFKKNLKKFFKHPYPGESCFKLIQQTKSVSKYYSRLPSIIQHITVREVAEKLKNAAETESSSKFKIGDAVTFESYSLTKEEIECYYKLIVMDPSIKLLSKYNMAAGECPSAIPEINLNDEFDVTCHPNSLNLVSSPLKLVSNPLNLLSTQIFQDDQIMKDTSFENGATEINNMPNHDSSMQNVEENIQKIIENNSQKLIEDDSQKIIEDDSQKIIEVNTQRIIEDNTQRIIEDSTQKITEDNTQKITEDNTQKITEDNTQKITEDNTQKITEDNTQKIMKIIPKR
ncbi:AAA_11 domain-containing protein [Trichonephila clavata]|uniref:AAA_11 domain-containing protein n=1 Tax=Trichonephila clavata TaxID=2740835 RepID=A0A8X6FQ49_TRICU|nr:AAA_11 domain-containing protein [Trichonephila clavata]